MPTFKEAKALVLLRSFGYYGAGCSDFGAEYFGDRAGRVSAVHGGGDYAAQMVLGRLRRKGLVMVDSAQPGSSRWILTSRGRRIAEWWDR